MKIRLRIKLVCITGSIFLVTCIIMITIFNIMMNAQIKTNAYDAMQLWKDDSYPLYFYSMHWLDLQPGYEPYEGDELSALDKEIVAWCKENYRFGQFQKIKIGKNTIYLMAEERQYPAGANIKLTYMDISSEASLIVTINSWIGSTAILFTIVIITLSYWLGTKSENAYAAQEYMFDAFRRSWEAKSLFSCEINITKDIMVRNNEFFAPNLWNGTTSVSNMVANFIKLNVHPEDRNNLLIAVGNPDYYHDKLEHDPSFDLCFRVSPSAIPASIDFETNANTKFRAAHHEWIWLQIHIVVTKNIFNELYLFITLTDIDKHMQEEQYLLEKATIDSLTTCYNRFTMESIVTKYLSNADQDTCGTLLLLDMDNFKSVNDIFGHPTGDKLLVKMAEILRSFFRSDDIIARLGGDEFVVFMIGMNDTSALKEMLTSLNKKMCRTITADNKQSVRVSCSMGVAIFPLHGKSFHELYQSADQALYTAKKAGRNTFRIFQA